MRRIVFLSILSIVFVISCMDDPGEIGSSFSGVVTDSVSGQPIESAWVYTGDTTAGYATATDSTGAYVWANFGYGPSKVLVRKASYMTGVRTFPKWRGDKKGVDFRLVPE